MDTAAVMLLSAVSVPVLAVAGLLSMRFLPKLRIAGVAAVAVALSLTVLGLLTFVLFSIQGMRSGVVLGTSIAAPLVTYGVVHMVAANKYGFGVLELLAGTVGGLFPLLYLGAHLWLLVGCGVAKECL